MKDMYHESDIKAVVLPKLYTTGITGTAEIDLQGFNEAQIEITVGNPGDTLGASVHLTALITHADDDGTGSAGDYANVAAKDIVGMVPSSGICLDVNANAEASQVYRFGYVGGKRFVTVLITVVGTHSSGTIVGVNVVKGDPMDTPADWSL